MIASVTQVEANMLQQYTYSSKNKADPYIAQMIHTYVSRCEFFLVPEVFWIILTLVYFVSSVVWTFKICQRKNMGAQKWISIIFFFKIYQEMFSAILSANCPWKRGNWLQDMIMENISVEMDYFLACLFHAFFLLLARGYNTINERTFATGKKEFFTYTLVVLLIALCYEINKNVVYYEDYFKVFDVVMILMLLPLGMYLFVRTVMNIKLAKQIAAQEPENKDSVKVMINI